MKNLKKVLAIVVTLTLLLVTVLPTMAATSAEIETYAGNLYNLGLYAGTSADSYEPALESPLTREQAFIIYAKIMGKASRAAEVTADQIKAYLTDVFVDANQFEEWAKPFATVLIMDKDISGRGDFTMGPKDTIKGSELGVLMLKALKEPVDYSTSVYACVKLWNPLNIITFAESAQLNDVALTRGDAILIMWKTIANGKIKNGEYVAKDLVNKGVMSESSARAVGLLATYDAATAASNASAATAAAEAAVSALQAAPYATQADFEAYELLLADANTKIAAAPAATQAGFNARVAVKVALVQAAIDAQVVAADLAVDAYTSINKADVVTVDDSLAAITVKTDAIAAVNAIMDVDLRAPFLAAIEAQRAILEAKIFLDVTSADADSATLKADGESEVLLTVALKDAFGVVLAAAPATTVNLAVDANGDTSSNAITLYNGVGEVLFAVTELNDGDDDVTAVVTATVAAGNYQAGASDTFEVTQTADALPEDNELVSAKMTANQTDRIVLTFEAAINPADVSFDDADSVIDNAHVDKKVSDPANNKNVIVTFKSTSGLNFVSGTEYTVSVGGVDAKFKLTDTQKPYITGVALGSDYKTVVVTFSEPIIEVGAASAVLNGVTGSTGFSVSGNKATLTFANYIADGNATITIGSGAVQDFTVSANKNALQTKSFVVAEPDVEIEADATVYSPLLTAIEFNSDVDVDTADVTLEKYNYDTAEWDDVAAIDYTVTQVDDDTVFVEFNALVANYFNKLYKITVAEDAVMDVDTGVTNGDDFEFDIAYVEDEDAPVLVGFDVDTEDADDVQFEASFSEPVDETDMTIAIQALDDDGDDVGAAIELDAADIDWDEYRMVATFSADLALGTEYRVEIDGVADDCGNENDDVIEPANFATEEEAAAEDVFEIDSIDIDVDNNVLTINFTQDLVVTDNNSTNALYLGNYRYDEGAGYVYFADDAVIEMTDANTITITADVIDADVVSIIVSELLVSADGLAIDGRTADAP